MKAVILAGGYGTRISEESGVRPKPMVEIGGMPILWHIMKSYSYHGINEFIICCGYKGYMIKEYFSNYFLHRSDVTFDLGSNTLEFHQHKVEKWKITLIDTGEGTMTGGRLKKVENFIGDEHFCLTYGDGVSDVDIKSLIAFHNEQGKLATLTAVHQPGRFGVFNLKQGQVNVSSFKEKPNPGEDGSAWINGGFFVCSPQVMEFISGDDTIWEREPLEKLAATKNLAAYRHEGFWQPMDTLRDRNVLEDLWQTNKAPWKLW